MKENNYLNLTNLKERGWTDSIIKKMGVEPDKEVVNPNYRSAAPIKLYDIKRIEELENTDKFKTLFNDSLKRKMGAKKATETKMQNMKDYVHSIQIQIPNLPKEQVFKQAVAHYNDFWTWRGYSDKYIYDYRILDDKTLERITCNMFRHSITDYDNILESKYGKVGVEYAHEYLKNKINQIVHNTYFQDVAFQF